MCVFSFQLSVELLDYMDEILGLQAASKTAFPVISRRADL